MAKLRSGLLLGAVAAAMFALFYAMDVIELGRLVPDPVATGPEALRSALGNLPEVVVALLGIAMTVVSILVQLAATRYTPKITGMFLRDPTNVSTMAFFVTTTVFCVWVSFAIGDHFVPYTLVAVTLGLISFSVLLLVPYFGYVFELVDPEGVLERMGERCRGLTRAERGDHKLRERQRELLDTVEDIAAVGVNSLYQRERVIAGRTATVLKDFLTAYMEGKPGLPQRWFDLGEVVAHDPDFEAMAAASSRDLERRKVWVEWKVLRQYQILYTEAGGSQEDVACRVAIAMRQLGERAMVRPDRPALGLIVRYFNTLLRVDISRGRVRAAYNLLHQYRQLAEAAIRAREPGLAGQIAEHLLYYAHTALRAGLDFICETIAYDLATLCELAHGLAHPEQDALLAVLLRVDLPPERPDEDRALRGVRKAQAKLATYYLSREDWGRARAIFQDMSTEPSRRLHSIRDELLAVSSREFWEIVDRGYNFDYIEDERRAWLPKFFEWFEVGGIPY